MTTGLGVLSGPRVAVIVASIDARATAPASLSRFAEEVRGRGEVVLADASRDGTADEVARRVPGVRVLRRPSGLLAPELWRAGLDATDAPLVAFTTAAMTPAPGWLDALLVRLGATGAAAVGGPIVPGEGLSPTDRAVYLMRYVNYNGPFAGRVEPEPAGDNALYRRDRLGGLGGANAHGFWEAEVHRHLRARGERLALAPGAVVTFRGGCRLLPTLGQRYRHARRYGAARGAGLSPFGKLARAATAPAVPAVLLGRAAATLRRQGQSFGPWLSAGPALAPLLVAWAAGEACGVLTGPGRGPALVGRVGRGESAATRERAGEGAV